jgi:hypothetical protein|nr:MAG TPA: hypothetical protein [Caudoviricetes sp.]
MKKSEYPDWLVPLKLAKKLKEIGFRNKSCFYYSFEDSSLFVFSKPENYNKKCNKDKFVTIPTWEQAFSWFRNKGYKANIDYVFHPDLKCVIGYLYEIIHDFEWEKYSSYYISYEIAREECLKSLINIYNGTNKR